MDTLRRETTSPGFTNETSWLSALAVGLVTFHLVQLWMKIRELPPGPIPLPIVGNILSFWSSRRVIDVLTDLKKRYGGIFTVFVAGKPFIIVADWNMAKEALIEKRNGVISRPGFRAFGHAQKEYLGIAFDKSDKNWEVTRKIAGAAVRKFVDGEKLATIVHNDTQEFVEYLLKFEGQPIEPSTEIQKMVSNIIAETAFGAKGLTPADYQKMMNLYKMTQELFGNTPGDIATWLLVIYYQRDQTVKRVSKDFGEFLMEKYAENKKTFQKGEIRNFSDAVLTCSLEANDDKDIKEYLDDRNMMKIIGVLFAGASETTATSLRWMLLFMANFPETQRKLIAEIDQNIGDRMPLQADRRNCSYTWAFISETLRFRTPVPLGIPHFNDVDTEVGGFKVKKGNIFVFHAEAVHMDPSIWPEPESFKPERFLKGDGTFNHDRAGFLAFGEGKRICPGEKLARNDIFLVLANLLQKVRVRLDGPPGSADLEPQNTLMICLPKLHQIIFEKRK